MIRQLNLVWRGGTTVHELLRFSVVGTVNTLLDFGVYLLLTRLTFFGSVPILLAAFISWFLAVLSSFLLNNYWTFGQRDLRLRMRLGRFIAVAAAGGGWNLLILVGLVTLGLNDILSKIIATIVVIIWNFTLQKFWTFELRTKNNNFD